MKKIFYLFALISVTAIKADALQVVPGDSIGVVKIGMKRAEVDKALNTHSNVIVHKYGVTESVYTKKQSGFYGLNRTAMLDVIYQYGAVVQIATNALDATLTGFGSIFQQNETVYYSLEAHYPSTVQSVIYFDSGKDTEKIHFWDDINKGLAFSVDDSAISFSKKYAIDNGRPFPIDLDFIIIHKIGRKFIPVRLEEWGNRNVPKGYQEQYKQNIQKLKPAQKSALKKCLTPLKQLSYAYSAGASFDNFSKRYVDTVVKVKSYMENLPDGYDKSEVNATLTAFGATKSSWANEINCQVNGVKDLSLLMTGKSYSENKEEAFGEATKHIKNIEKRVR